MKRLEIIEDKNEEQLEAIKNKAENIKEVADFVEEPLSPEAIALINEIRSMQKDVDYRKLKFRGGGDSITYDFSDHKAFKELLTDIYYRNMSINKAERKQDEFNTVLNVLSRYSPRNEKYIKAKNELLDNATNFYKGREGIIEGFKNGIFLLIKKDFHSDGQRPDLPATSDSSIDESHCLTDKELQMFEKLFSCKNREELEQALMRADTEEK